MMDARYLANFVFHIYNRSNDRSTLFATEDNYRIFLKKMTRQLEPAVDILGYCIMPNHFHLMVIPKNPIREDFPLDGERYTLMPTPELGEAVRRWLMGYTKSYNKFHGITGSRFQAHSKAKHHKGGISNGLKYLHRNPVIAGLVTSPEQWSWSSFNEYAGAVLERDCICNLELGRALINL